MTTVDDALPLRLQPGSELPPFAQIRDGIVRLAASGELRPGDRLPTVRGLAAKLEVAPNTVAKAYRELEEAGVVQTRGRRGTYLALDGDRARREAFGTACAFVDRAKKLGLEDEDIRILLERALTRHGAV
jgi:DNA-binding transcriptional regulator YhcF (GntR family)